MSNNTQYINHISKVATVHNSRTPLLAAAYLDTDSVLYLMKKLSLNSAPLTLDLYSRGLTSREQQAIDDHAFSALLDAQLINSDGDIDRALAAWLYVLCKPDISASAMAREGPRLRRVVVAQRGGDHVMAARIGEELVIQSIWSRGRSVDDLVAAPLWDSLMLPGHNMDPPAAAMQSVTFTRKNIKSGYQDQASQFPKEIDNALKRNGQTAQVLDAVMNGEGQRCHIMVERNWGTEIAFCPAAVLVADTSFGRVISGT
ncbi:ESX secretion-associated protein EspG [Mycobacterium montefiorense]|uniref:Uncharacterized protein n=1 Tax=Mycobacterium montefiorense TaxID=154654 RepID=A0AA37PQ24_9MYCO|nr:ESX secretion-associated protein EspG [Mycobacterium montefiorense]GBG40593.1 hypothetical protein MmonteBS_49650 [Mycobacterium montefiorense]GKU33426.1 hypothetical protein NJB14191_07730 [Mycobacterium montefiorense]GKU39237.1 hypothetical protein NJB14192_12320 [Mycobacterium montefiorense]GKU44774.1 hypothetical protein NJB14194_14000 [Mycobacterium montefiorense]GKU52070.1 hypothetical protein NJB14195_33140 [Mycobacterium montefiorense]